MTSAFHVYFGPEALAATPRARQIGPGDCFSALKEGLDDFLAMPTYPIFIGLFYAVAGIAPTVNRRRLKRRRPCSRYCISGPQEGSLA